MMQLVAWPVLLPLVAGFLILFAKAWGLNLQRLINLIVVIALITLNISLLNEASTGEYNVYLLGNWQAPFGIVLVLDQLSALMITITSILALASLVYAIVTNTDSKGAHFHVLFQLILFGLNGAFLTGDLFNLFVFFEVLLLASYGLLLHGGGRARTKAGLHYVVINLVGATLFLFGVGALYGVFGTLNIADMAAMVASLPEEDFGLVAAAGLILLVVFGVKAALFPLYLWLPISYANTSAAVATLFAIMTKVGIYSIIRVHGTIFGDDAGQLANYYMPWVLGLGLLTLLIAAFGVMAAKGLREQVSYLVLASVATLLIAGGINTPTALNAAFYYLIHSTFIAGAMFILADIIARGRGSFNDRFESGFALPQAILVGSFFMFGAIAMTGMPPLSGFFGKVLILNAALDHAWAAIIFTVVLVAGLLMIITLAKTGSLLFYNTLPKEEKSLIDADLNQPKQQSVSVKESLVVIGLFALIPLLVIFAQPITQFTESAAKQHFNSKHYVDAVLSQQPILRNQPSKAEE